MDALCIIPTTNNNEDTMNTIINTEATELEVIQARTEHAQEVALMYQEATQLALEKSDARIEQWQEAQRKYGDDDPHTQLLFAQANNAHNAAVLLSKQSSRAAELYENEVQIYMSYLAIFRAKHGVYAQR